MEEKDILMLKELMKEVVSEVIREEVSPRLDTLEAKMDALEKRMDALEKRMDALEKRMDALEKRMDALEKRMDALENTINTEVLPKLSILVENSDIMVTRYEFEKRMDDISIEIQKIVPIVEVVARHSEIINGFTQGRFKIYNGGKLLE